MRAQDNDRTSATARDRTPARATPAEDAESLPGLSVLQGSMGNEAVVQMLRRAGHAGAREEQRHDDGHERAAGHPQVQRSAVHDVLRRSGRPLDEATRADMGERLGADFSDVRVHDDAAARASAAEVGARAYTSGNHIVIGADGDDAHTLAHELTHVIQQRNGPVAGTDNGAGLRVSDPSDRFEREAEANARRVMSAGPARAGGPEAAGGRRVAGGGSGKGASVQRASRYDNPRPSEAKGEMTEHHIIPYSLLDKFVKALRKSKAGDVEALFGSTMPSWDKVTIGELTRLRVIRPEVVRGGADCRVPADKVRDGSEEFPGADGANEEAVKKARDGLLAAASSWPGIKAGDDTPGEVGGHGIGGVDELSAPYYYWASFNLFVGPKERTWDPGAKFDDWAEHFLPEGQVSKLREAFGKLGPATKTNKKGGYDKEAVIAAHECLKSLIDSFGSVPLPAYDPTKWTAVGSEWQPTNL
ncbi:DUF4157 domain-containing protein [Streptomyces sp. NPDC015350]|uniref:eCIS core domain-containing protein n=1 Tax=Streptomyces sp. NPDC015350 TaxID=3364955 RepID=UPI003700A1B0